MMRNWRKSLANLFICISFGSLEWHTSEWLIIRLSQSDQKCWAFCTHYMEACWLYKDQVYAGFSKTTKFRIRFTCRLELFNLVNWINGLPINKHIVRAVSQSVCQWEKDSKKTLSNQQTNSKCLKIATLTGGEGFSTEDLTYYAHKFRNLPNCVICVHFSSIVVDYSETLKPV